MTPLDCKDSKGSDQTTQTIKTPPLKHSKLERYFNNRFITIGQQKPAGQLRGDQFLSQPWWNHPQVCLEITPTTNWSSNRCNGANKNPRGAVHSWFCQQKIIPLKSPKISATLFWSNLWDFVFPHGTWRDISEAFRYRISTLGFPGHTPRDWIATIISTALPKVAFNKPVTLRWRFPSAQPGMKWPNWMPWFFSFLEASRFWKHKRTPIPIHDF